MIIFDDGKGNKVAKTNDRQYVVIGSTHALAVEMAKELERLKAWQSELCELVNGDNIAVLEIHKRITKQKEKINADNQNNPA